MIRWLVVVWLALGAVTAHANTTRIAVIVGNNTGNADRTSLHYAEADAAKFARVLGELGGVAAENLFVLQGKPLQLLTETFAVVKHRISELHGNPGNRVIVLFYFSGHSDGEALELGPDRLTFAELRQWLASAGADVRVALVDSCKSGALLAVKGGKPGPEFQIRLTDELASTGEVLLTSSAADEVALESREIGGSFFTHHFISGLRGAADTSEDGLVTLAEAYQYAYARTLKTTGQTVLGAQHPAYDYRLSGQGELVLAELAKRSAMLVLPAGFDRILVIDTARDQVIAEVAADGRARLAVQPGSYEIRTSRGGQLFAGRVAVAMGQEREVTRAMLAPTTAVATTSKGALDPAPGLAIMAAAGGSTAVGSGIGPIASVRIAVVTRRLSLALDAGTGARAGVRESSLHLAAGYRLGVARGPWSGWAGLELGGGGVLQTAMHPAAYSALLTAGGVAGGSVAVAPRLAFGFEAALPATWLKRDGGAALAVLPGAWLGVIARY